MADLFVKQAHAYKNGRPDYPESLYQLLASFTPIHELAWDVGTGNGQAAAAAAAGAGSQTPNVETPAELSEEELHIIVGEEGSVDLVTVAQAIHWFDLDLFYGQVKHILRKPGGVLAVWSYLRQPSVNSAVDKVFDEFDQTTEPYWAPQLAIIQSELKTLAFPFEAVDGRGVGPIPLESVKQMSFLDYLLYLRSWSGVTTALSQGIDLLNEEVQKKFLDVWGPAEMLRSVTFQLALLVGTVPHDGNE